ncbi:conserved protein of unknown function [Cyanobium sp. NIES-981]|nr:conserved protein of unknown function [Cyanobium sp. NIES-981]
MPFRSCLAFPVLRDAPRAAVRRYAICHGPAVVTEAMPQPRASTPAALSDDPDPAQPSIQTSSAVPAPSMTPSLLTTLRTVPGTAAGPSPVSRSLRVPTNPEPSLSLRQQISHHEEQARRAAADGQVDEAARSILQALQCERRLANSGPQVLQLIKPRA